MSSLGAHSVSTSNRINLKGVESHPTATQHLPFPSSLDTHYYRFKLTNKGRRVQQLFWMNDGFRPKEKQSKKEAGKKGSTGSRQSKVSQEPIDHGNPVFQLHPVRMELYPGQTIDVILEGYSATPKVRGERVQNLFFSQISPCCYPMCFLGRSLGNQRMTRDVVSQRLHTALVTMAAFIAFKAQLCSVFPLFL